jgi:hypothetical protein
MADDKYYCGCGHSAWGMLLLFSVIQVFLSSSLFPGVVEIFDGLIALRSARSNIETAATNLDAGRTATSNSTAVGGSFFTVNAASTGTAGTSIWEYPPANYQVLQLNYQDATLRNAAVYSRSFSFSKTPAWTDVTIQNVVSKVDPNTGAALAYDVWMVPSTSFYFAVSGNRVTASASATKLGSFDASVAAYNVSGLNIASTYEKKVTSMITTAMIRTEAFGGFFFLQWIIGLVVFGLALRHYHLQTPPTVLPILSVVGLVFMFLGWVVGWFYNSPWNLSSIFGSFLTTTGTTFTEWAATPYVGLLILNWVLLLIYSNYTLAFVNNGGKDEPETPAYQQHNMGNTFTNTFKNFTGKLGNTGRNSTPAKASVAGEGKTTETEAAALD